LRHRTFNSTIGKRSWLLFTWFLFIFYFNENFCTTFAFIRVKILWVTFTFVPVFFLQYFEEFGSEQTATGDSWLQWRQACKVLSNTTMPDPADIIIVLHVVELSYIDIDKSLALYLKPIPESRPPYATEQDWMWVDRSLTSSDAWAVWNGFGKWLKISRGDSCRGISWWQYCKLLLQVMTYCTALNMLLHRNLHVFAVCLLYELRNTVMHNTFDCIS